MAFIRFGSFRFITSGYYKLKAPISHYNAGQRSSNGERGELDDIGNYFENIANSAFITFARNNIAKI